MNLRGDLRQRAAQRLANFMATREIPHVTLGRSVKIDRTARLQALGGTGGRSPVGGEISVGDSSTIGPGAVIAAQQGSITIGKFVFIGPHVVLYGAGGITIGDKTQIAAHAVVVAANHRFDDPSTPIIEQGLTALGITIGRDVWIAAGAKILDGVTIGDGAVVAAGAVVRSDVPPLAVVAGVPATVIRYRGESR